jgi:uncharacterized protein YutE (UPF0331/DUF86 family)
MLSELGVEAPETYRGVVEKAHAAGVINEGLKRWLSDVVGFDL